MHAECSLWIAFLDDKKKQMIRVGWIQTGTGKGMRGLQRAELTDCRGRLGRSE